MRIKNTSRTKKRILFLSALGGGLIVAVALFSPISSPIVSAVQNIFTGLGKVKDIQYGNKKVLKVLYRGEVVWEREPDGPPEPDPNNPTTYGAMQLMSSAKCSTARGTAFDVRNNQTYYVQKIGNLCWMESNLRYEGGGDNTYGDAKTLTLRSSGASTNAVAEYSNPGGSTDYTNTTANGGFYGYLYNWCAAMGGQTNACDTTSTTGFDTTTSICPAGWRLPTGGDGGEYQTMAAAIGATNDAAGSANLRNQFLAVYSGRYRSGLSLQGTNGGWWSSTVFNANATYAHYLNFNANFVNSTNSSNRVESSAVRCVAD